MHSKQTLLPDHVLHLRAGRRRQFYCHAGCVWLSAHGQDVLLSAGAQLQLPGGDSVLLEAVRGPALLAWREDGRSIMAALRLFRPLRLLRLAGGG